jgi:glycosyltransferase involved in cell wall biosynthesis
MRILHVITGPLGLGGAEVMLHRLLAASDLESSTHEVVCLTEAGVVADRIRALGVKTHALGLRRLPDPRALARLARLMTAFRPDVVQTWMYHADLVGGVTAALATDAKIVWGIHNNALDPGAHRTTRWTVRVCARLSRRIPDRIVCVSRASAELHAAAGYAREKLVVLPNGFDVRRFRPDPAARRELRRELGLEDAHVVVGLVARIHPQKDHLTFVRAAELLAARRPDVRFLLCGLGTSPPDPPLAAAIARAGLEERMLLLGRREDVQRVMCGLDVGTLSSTSEAFPLVVGELMACGVPCVVTDVGDCAFLVGDTGLAVPPRDPQALARAWEALVDEGAEARRQRGLAARDRIARHFDIARIAGEYDRLYREALGEPPLHSLG